MNILLADDTRTIHAFVTMLFSETSHDLTHVFDGAEAVDIFTNTPEIEFDVILLDWEMPNLSGIETLERLRGMGVTTPIIMVTSKNSLIDIQKAISLGANEYVMKPFTQEILFEKIFEVVGEEV